MCGLNLLPEPFHDLAFPDPDFCHRYRVVRNYRPHHHELACGFQVLNLRQPLVAQIWFGLNRLLEPIYGPIRKILPNMGGLDLAPMVVIFSIFALRTILYNNISAFG